MLYLTQRLLKGNQKMKANIILKTLIILSLLYSGSMIFAKEGDVVVRVRATNISPNENSDLYDEKRSESIPDYSRMSPE